LRGLKMLNETIRRIPWSSIIKYLWNPKPNKATKIVKSIKICEGTEYNSNRRAAAIKIGVMAKDQ
jgi:hypothetical protein